MNDLPLPVGDNDHRFYTADADDASAYGVWDVRAGLEEWLSGLTHEPDPARLALIRSVADQIDRSRLGPMRRACELVLALVSGSLLPDDVGDVASALKSQLEQFAGPLPPQLVREYRSLLDEIEAGGGEDETDPFTRFATMGNAYTTG